MNKKPALHFGLDENFVAVTARRRAIAAGQNVNSTRAAYRGEFVTRNRSVVSLFLDLIKGVLAI
jgi:hypothetical protein